jgi:hypothetical protein
MVLAGTSTSAGLIVMASSTRSEGRLSVGFSSLLSDRPPSTPYLRARHFSSPAD